MVNLFKLRLQTEYLRFLLKRNARYMLIMSIAMLTLYPVLGITVKILSRSASYDGIREAGLFFNIGLLLLTSFLIPLQIHGYMNSKKNLDVYHALPIKRQDLFLTSLIASILIIAGPFTIGWFSGGLLMMNDTFTFFVILERYIVLLSVSSVILSIVLFTMMNTGTTLDAFLYSLTLNFLPLLAYGAYILFVQTILLGFTIGDLTKYITVIFPIWAMFDNGFALRSGLWHSAYANAFYWLIVTTVFIIIANQFYLRRKSEKAEKPFTNKTFFPVVSGLIVILSVIFEYCVIYNLNSTSAYTSFYNPINFIFPLFLSGVFYLVMDAIAQRGFKHLFKAFLTYLIIAAVALTIIVGGIFTKGFGYASKIPTLDNIQSIQLEYNDYSKLVLPSPSTYNDTSYPNQFNYQPVLTLTTAEDIKTVYDLHKIIISEFKWVDYNFSVGNGGNLVKIIEEQKGYTKSYKPLPYPVETSYGGNQVNIKITYHLKNGSKLQRSYSIPAQWTGVLLQLSNSAEIINIMAPNLAKAETFSKVSSAFWNTPLMIDPIDVHTTLDLNALRTAYLADLAALSDTQSNSTEYTAAGTLLMNTCLPNGVSCIASNVALDARFPRSLAYLTSIGVDMNPVLPPLPAAALLIPLSASNTVVSSPIFQLGVSPAYSMYNADLWNNFNTSTPRTLSYVMLTEDEAKAILPYVSQSGMSDVPLMSLAFANMQGNLLIQAQYMDEVNAIIAGKPVLTTTDIYSIFTGVNPK
jgi:hypothetical protein